MHVGSNRFHVLSELCDMTTIISIGKVLLNGDSFSRQTLIVNITCAPRRLSEIEEERKKELETDTNKRNHSLE